MVKSPNVDAVLSLENVCKNYNPGTAFEAKVLKDINLTLNKGDFCALIGPSGSGKSTLLNIIGLLDRPTSGKLYLNGAETSTMKDKDLTHLRGKSIGFVFQYHHLITAFTALENVMMPYLIDKGWPDDEMQKKAEALIEQVGLTQWKDNGAANMSGGQQQRVAIARALAMNPALILADEPTGNLDGKSADLVFDLMRKVNQDNGTTFLIVTHNLELAKRTDRIVEVVDGRVV